MHLAVSWAQNSREYGTYDEPAFPQLSLTLIKQNFFISGVLLVCFSVLFFSGFDISKTTIFDKNPRLFGLIGPL